VWAIEQGIHVLLVDLLLPGNYDPRGLHGAIWETFDEEQDEIPPGQPLSLASYMADLLPQAHVVHLSIGDMLPEMPLFLQRHAYVLTPLEPTYMVAFQGMPSIYRSVLEGSPTST
jgi:hypothetical protein